MSEPSAPETPGPVASTEEEQQEAVMMDEDEELGLVVKKAKALGLDYHEYQVLSVERGAFLWSEVIRNLGSSYRNLGQTVGVSKSLKMVAGDATVGPTILEGMSNVEVEAAQRQALETLMLSLDLEDSEGVQTSAKETYDMELRLASAPKRAPARRKRKIIDDSSESEAETTDGEGSGSSDEEEDEDGGERRRLPSRSARPREGFAAPAPLPAWAYDTPRRPKGPRASGDAKDEGGEEDECVSLETATKEDRDKPRRLRSGRIFTTPTHTDTAAAATPDIRPAATEDPPRR